MKLPVFQADAAAARKVQAAAIRYALQEAALGNRLALMVSVQSFCRLPDAKLHDINKKVLSGRISLRKARQIIIAGWIENLAVGMPTIQAEAIKIAKAEFGIGSRAIERALKALRKIRGRVEAKAADRKCERCGEPFTAKRSTMRFCSARCRVAAHRVTLTVR